MATTMPCDSCNQEPGAVVVTLIDSGETQSLGVNCFPIFCLETAKAALSPDQLAELLGPIFVRAPEKASGSRRSRRGADPAPDTAEAAQEPQGEPAPRDDASSEEAAQES